MILRLHHIQITIPNGDESVARGFYLELLDLTEIPKPDSLKPQTGFWLSLAGQEIHVSLEHNVSRLGTKAHIAYEVSDLEVWRLRFKNTGFEVLEGLPIPGFERFETRDPFGNRLEFISTI